MEPKKSKFDKFDGYYVIPSHLEDRTSKVAQLETIRYWMVELTLTSGNVQAFYVKAKTKGDALVIAESLTHLATPQFQTRILKLRN